MCSKIRYELRLQVWFLEKHLKKHIKTPWPPERSHVHYLLRTNPNEVVLVPSAWPFRITLAMRKQQ